MCPQDSRLTGSNSAGSGMAPREVLPCATFSLHFECSEGMSEPFEVQTRTPMERVLQKQREVRIGLDQPMWGHFSLFWGGELGRHDLIASTLMVGAGNGTSRNKHAAPPWMTD